MWDETLKEEARDTAEKKDLAPWESWSTQPQVAFWREAKAKVCTEEAVPKAGLGLGLLQWPK